MASKSVLSTTLSFGFVTAPVGVKKMRDGDPKELKTHFGSPEGNPVSQRYLDKTTGAVFEQGELLRGVYDDYENGVGFHPLPDESLTAIEEACKIDGLVIDGFIPWADTPVERFEDTYYLAPKGGPAAAKSLALLRDAMAATGVAGIGKFTLRTKQRPFVVYADGNAVILAAVTFGSDCLSRAAEAQEACPIAAMPEHVELAKTLIDGMLVGREQLDAYVDDSIEQRANLIAAAVAGQTIEAPAPGEKVAPVVDLEAALLASISASPKAQAATKATKSKTPAKKAA